MNATTSPLRLAIAGLGAIGMTVARRVDEGGIEGMTLAAVSARDEARAFLSFLRGEAAQGALRDAGFPPPPAR